MATNMRLKIDTADKILLKRGLNKNGAGQKFFTHEVRRLSAPYVPNLTGTLEGTAQELTNRIEYVQPYARKQYYENSGKNKNRSPRAGKHWDRRMWADRGKEIVKAVSNFCGGRAK